MPYTSDLFETAPDRARIGGKAASLIELHRAGFTVPRGVCIDTGAYRAWCESSRLDGALREELLTAFRVLRKPLAVRSSSPAEDLEDASFAGQYVTVLGVETEARYLDAVLECWHSASSRAAGAYKERHAQAAAASMALVIQELVPATVAGVMFTMNPVTDRLAEIVINANVGLGESVVSGHAEPDYYEVDKASGATREVRIGSKRVFSRVTRDGVIQQASDPAQSAHSSLSPAQVTALWQAACRLEQHYDMPIDAEWAFADERLYLLQARPVTTGMAAYQAYLLDAWARERGLADPSDALWNRGSVLSGLKVSPLYYSEMSAFFADLFQRIAQLHGAPRLTQKMFCYFRGFTYTNAAFSTTADPSGNIEASSPWGAKWRANWRIGLRHPRSLAFWANIDYYDRRWREEWAPAMQAQRPNFDTATAAEIRRYIEFLETQRRERSVLAGLAVGYAPDFLGLLTWVLNRWLPDAPSDIAGLLTSGLPGSLTHEENVALWQLAQRAAASSLEDPEFLAAADQFRAEHACRGCSDRDIAQPRWGDGRATLLGQLRMMLDLGQHADPEVGYRRALAVRTRAEGQVEAALRTRWFGGVRARLLRRLLAITRRYVVHRDNQRHTFEPYFYDLRLCYLALGRRLCDAGILASADEVFFLGKHEIYQHLDGKLAASNLNARARWRREWWTRVTQHEPPRQLQGAAPAPELQPLSGADELSGAPGAPGVAEGPARIIGSLSELSRVRAGDIIVTYAIDPAWTPVFGIIAGVVSVEGGMLAHAAVLGREYGLPVVLSVRDATAAIKEGSRLQIDGTRGRVSIVTESH